jgi:NADH oxidase (H2O2-forming)
MDEDKKTMRHIVIIGCGAAGWSAAFSARKIDRSSRVIVIEQEKDPMYERGGIPFVIQGDISEFDALVHFPPKHYEAMKIDLCTETLATRIDAQAKLVTFIDKRRNEQEFNYDSLVLATGARANVIQVPGYTLPEVYGVRTLDDGRAIDANCVHASSATIIGARLVGLEMAVALKTRGVDVTVIEVLPQILDGILDPELAAEVQERLENLGIHFILGTGLSEILGHDHVDAVRAGTNEVASDMVVMAAGVHANTELAQQMGIILGATNLIKVDEHMATNVEGVFAAGDCVECVNAITNSPTVSQLGTNAIRQGKVAGANAAGGCMVYPKILGASITRLHDTVIASTGLTESRANTLGIDSVSASVRVPSRPLSYPERLLVQVKLVANKSDGRLIGAQIMSRKEVGPRIDAITLAILKKASVNDLILFDHAYSPPVAESTDPLSVAAEVLHRKIS